MLLKIEGFKVEHGRQLMKTMSFQDPINEDKDSTTSLEIRTSEKVKPKTLNL
jgi:hypothetical protein